MQQVVAGGTAAASLSGFAWPAAGKTGTATNGLGEVSSAWFAGYTAQYSTAVMYVRGKGNEQLKGWLPEYFGGAYPARTWRAVMHQVMEGEDPIEFPEPAYVDGDAPDEGHEPYTPPPPKPSNTKTDEPETEVTDSDGDGTPDDEDACPDNPDIPGSPDADGDCQVDAQDSDGDGVADGEDPCPNNADIPGQPDADGDCVVDEDPQTDSDGDGTPDAQDPCPDNADIPDLPDNNGNCVPDQDERDQGGNDRFATGAAIGDLRRRARRRRRRTPVT